MSLADGCIVRMVEIYERHAVLTLDADFSVYRKHGAVAAWVCDFVGRGGNDRGDKSIH